MHTSTLRTSISSTLSFGCLSREHPPCTALPAESVAWWALPSVFLTHPPRGSKLQKASLFQGAGSIGRGLLVFYADSLSRPQLLVFYFHLVRMVCLSIQSAQDLRMSQGARLKFSYENIQDEQGQAGHQLRIKASLQRPELSCRPTCLPVRTLLLHCGLSAEHGPVVQRQKGIQPRQVKNPGSTSSWDP